MNVLFICSRNRWRSRTAEHLYKNSQQLFCRSAGTAASARIKVNAELMQWADVIFAMEQKHKKYLLEQFSAEARQKEIIVLDIPDNYDYMNPELIELIREGVENYLAAE